MKSPLNHRYLQVLGQTKNSNVKLDTEQQALASIIVGDKDSSKEYEFVSRAYDVFMHTYKREVLESLLLAGSTTDEIYGVLQFPKEIVEVYKRLFFDTTQFEDELDRIEYAESFTGCPYGEQLKKAAVERGKETLLVKFSRGNYHISAETALNSVRAMAYVLAQSALNNPADSAISREAHRWAQLCLRSADDKGPETVDTVEKMMIDLETEDSSTNAEKSGIKPDDILR